MFRYDLFARTALILSASALLFPACGTSGDSDSGYRRPVPGTGGAAGVGGSGGTGTGGSGGADSDAGGSGGGQPCVNGEQQACGTDEGACVAGYSTCANGSWGPCLHSKGPTDETCDGQDHDCDGTPNNPPAGCECEDGASRDCYGGPAGTEGVGSCQAGSETCVAGVWGDCQGAIEPQAGRCDVLSCTGELNPGCACLLGESTACFSGNASLIDVGACREGVSACVADGSTASKWGPCVGEVLPETELCDGEDHDCNGTPNDPPAGCTCTPGTTQSCYTGPSSTLGQGTCAAGSQSCVLNGGAYVWGPCQGDVTPVPGDCDHASCTGANALNTGCTCLNGSTEDCYTGPVGTEDVGTCTGGQRTCAIGAWGACIGQTLPTTLDACVPANATYSAYVSSDASCNGSLDRHAPSPAPTVTAPTGSSIAALPSTYVAGLQVLPLDTVTMHGFGTDPDGTGPLGYRWRLISTPAGNAAGLSGAPGATPNDSTTEQHPTLFAQVVGDYEVGVRVLDATGCESAEVVLLVRVKPNTAVHVQLTWDESTDVDLHMVRGGTTPFGAADACYFANPNPDWGAVDPSLDIDDIAGCNPENIHFGESGGALPPVGSDYALYVHYFCDYRGHRVTENGDPTYICYEPDTLVTAPVIATVRVFIDGQLAKIQGTNQDAVFEGLLEYWDLWKPARLEYDNSGIWRVHASTDPLSYVTGCDGVTSPTCVCDQDPNTSDPYCGENGAACRQLYP